jgi:hypothetical protein
MMPICYFEGCEREARNQIFSTADDEPKGVVVGFYCSKHYQWAFYKAIEEAEARGFQKGVINAQSNRNNDDQPTDKSA